MKMTNKRFSYSYGNYKVVLNKGAEIEPFQDVNAHDIAKKLIYNRFTYESIKKLYDVEVFINGDIRYLINMKASAKCIYHEQIEKHFKDEILETLKHI